jgi:hypothetical protein
MATRPLVIDDTARAKVAAVLAHAEKNHYREGGPTPGDDPRFVAHLDTYRAVFSFTNVKSRTYRHLSISVPAKGYPNPIAAFFIADLFGFTGYDQNTPTLPGTTWLLLVNKDEHCVVIVEPIMPATSKAWSN